MIVKILLIGLIVIHVFYMDGNQKSLITVSSLKELAAIELVCETINPHSTYYTQYQKELQSLKEKITIQKNKKCRSQKQRKSRNYKIKNYLQSIQAIPSGIKQKQLQDIIHQVAEQGIHYIQDTIQEKHELKLPQELIEFCTLTFFCKHILGLPLPYHNERDEENIKTIFSYGINHLYYIEPIKINNGAAICFFGKGKPKIYIKNYEDIATHLAQDNRSLNINLMGEYQANGKRKHNTAFKFKWPTCFHLLPNIESFIFTQGSLKYFKSLPQELTYFTKLTHLTFTYNALISIDESLFQSLALLEILNLAHNQLESLPKTINTLTKLTALDISYNKINQLPDEFKSLTQSKTISLDFYLFSERFSIWDALTNKTFFNLYRKYFRYNNKNPAETHIEKLKKLGHSVTIHEK